MGNPNYLFCNFDWFSIDQQPQQGNANNRTFSGAKTVGVLVGFYFAEELEVVISHPGERFHIHYADKDIKISGHLDQFGIGKGLALLFAKTMSGSVRTLTFGLTGTLRTRAARAQHV